MLLEKVKKLPIINTIFLLTVFGAFLYKAFYSLDPDFGWRLVAGKMYLSSGIPRTDPFSYTMPSFPWVDHAWGVSAFIGGLYAYISKLGLSLIFSAVAVLALLISLTRGKSIDGLKMYFFKIYEIDNRSTFLLVSIPFLLATSIIIPYTGVRAQVFTWLLLSILLRIVFDEKAWKKYRAYIPFYFLLWANVHGGYALGLGVIFVVVFSRIVKGKADIVDFSSAAASVLATLVNPYGVGSWREVWSSISDNSLHFTIAEWMPSLLKMDLSFAYFIAASLIFVTRYRKKFDLAEIILFYLLFVQAMGSLRNIPLWLIVATPMLSSSFYYFFLEIKKNKVSISRFFGVYKVAWLIAVFAFVVQMSLVIKSTKSLSEPNFYPQNAIVYLKNNPPDGQIFSFYGWGGYLIWKYPQKKVFIDGRMPSWTWSGGEQNEENAAFKTYIDIQLGEADYRQVFEKYSISAVLWPKIYPENKNFLQKKLDELVARMGYQKNSYDLLATLKNNGWTVKYEDNVAQILQKH